MEVSKAGPLSRKTKSACDPFLCVPHNASTSIPTDLECSDTDPIKTTFEAAWKEAARYMEYVDDSRTKRINRHLSDLAEKSIWNRLCGRMQSQGPNALKEYQALTVDECNWTVRHATPRSPWCSTDVISYAETHIRRRSS